MSILASRAQVDENLGTCTSRTPKKKSNLGDDDQWEWIKEKTLCAALPN